MASFAALGEGGAELTRFGTVVQITAVFCCSVSLILGSCLATVTMVTSGGVSFTTAGIVVDFLNGLETNFFKMSLLLSLLSLLLFFVSLPLVLLSFPLLNSFVGFTLFTFGAVLEVFTPFNGSLTFDLRHREAAGPRGFVFVTRGGCNFAGKVADLLGFTEVVSSTCDTASSTSSSKV